MNPHQIAISSIDNEKVLAARKLADKMNLAFLPDPKSEAAKRYDFLLVYTHKYLGLYKRSQKNCLPFHIDFLSGKMLYRSKRAGLRKELLARAAGLHPRENPTIIDATAGLGRDSFILASLGFNITLLERSPVLYALLTDAFARAKQDATIAPIIERMHLIHANSIDWLSSHQPVDIIYLDPMFPERRKSAAVKKEMLILQELLGKDVDSDQLVKLALTCASHRIVVKRPRLAENISQHKPNFSLMGTNSRFDIYLGKASYG